MKFYLSRCKIHWTYLFFFTGSWGISTLGIFDVNDLNSVLCNRFVKSFTPDVLKDCQCQQPARQPLRLHLQLLLEVQSFLTELHQTKLGYWACPRLCLWSSSSFWPCLRICSPGCSLFWPTFSIFLGWLVDILPFLVIFKHCNIQRGVTIRFAINPK